MILFMYLIVGFIALNTVARVTAANMSPLQLGVALFLGVVSVDVHLRFPRRVVLPPIASFGLPLAYAIAAVLGVGVVIGSAAGIEQADVLIDFVYFRQH